MPVQSLAVNTGEVGLITKSPEILSIYNVIDEGYSIDLVLIAGIWVLYSIVKIIFFIFKVFYNVKNSKNYFQFKIPFQLIINDIDKAEVVKISEESLIFKVNMSNHLIKNKNEFNNVLLCLPSTLIKFNIEITSTSINKKSHIAISKRKFYGHLSQKGNCLITVFILLIGIGHYLTKIQIALFPL